MPLFRRLLVTAVAASLTIATLPLQAQPAGDSGLIRTEQLPAHAATTALQGDQARVAALTDAEAAERMARIDEAPAGSDVLGLLFTVFIVLPVTDILGFTKVFPFTRPIR